MSSDLAPVLPAPGAVPRVTPRCPPGEKQLNLPQAGEGITKRWLGGTVAVLAFQARPGFNLKSQQPAGQAVCWGGEGRRWAGGVDATAAGCAFDLYILIEEG